MSDSKESKSLAEYQRTVGRYETLNDSYLLPDGHVVLRLDAHRQANAHDIIPDKEYPFGTLFADGLADTARFLMRSSPYRTRFAFTHGDEISLLLSQSEAFGLRRRGKILSNISSIASIHLSKLLGVDMIFDTKLSELPTEQHVVDYFMWQRKVSFRNYCSRISGLLLTEWGASESDIAEVRRKIGDGNLALLKELGHNTENIADAFLRGLACWWTSEKANNKTKHQLTQSTCLPEEDKDYADFILSQVSTPGFRIEQTPASTDFLEVTVPLKVKKQVSSKATRTERASPKAGVRKSPTASSNWRISPVQRTPLKRRK